MAHCEICILLGCILTGTFTGKISRAGPLQGVFLVGLSGLPGHYWGASYKAPGTVTGPEFRRPGMGCTASVVHLQALRTLMRGSCARTCSNGQEQISLEVLQSLESELDSRPRTIIFTVMRFYLFVVWFPAGHAANICANFAELFMATF